jgi:hypothetical protein
VKAGALYVYLCTYVLYVNIEYWKVHILRSGEERVDAIRRKNTKMGTERGNVK